MCDQTGCNGMDLCPSCIKNLPWVKYACARCALPLANSSSPICGACSNKKIYFENTHAPFLFSKFIQEAIYEYKFNHKLHYGKLLAQLLLRHIENKKLVAPDILLPVPLYCNRIRKRGFNQSLEIARIVSKKIKCEINTNAVQRVRETHVQMQLPAKKRAANVKNAFVLNSRPEIFKDKHIAIIDDVMTTGNTANEVAKCLQKASAKKIDVWCIARVSARKCE